MITVSNSFTATGNGPKLLVRHGSSFAYALSGTFVANMLLRRSLDGGMTFETVLSFTGAASGNVLCETPARQNAVYHWKCDAYTSGTAVTTMIENADTLTTVKDVDGSPLFQVKRDGIHSVGEAVDSPMTA